MTFWPQYLAACAMLFAVASVARRTRDDEPFDRACAVFGTIVTCGLIILALNDAGFWAR